MFVPTCDEQMCAPREGGGDPDSELSEIESFVLPAKAGVILVYQLEPIQFYRAPREGGGDPHIRGSSHGIS